MNRRAKRTLATVLVIVLSVLLLSACGGGKEDKKMKVALLVQGPANDNGWNQSALNGVNSIGEELEAEVSVSENLALSDFEEFFRNYGKEEYSIVFGHGYAFADAAMNVAKDYPKTIFVITSADVTQEPNLISVKNSSAQQGFLSGAFAALYSESKKIGIVGGMEIPSIIGWLEGAKQGAAHVDPSVEVIANYTGNFEDSIAAKEMALAMIDEGADVMLQNLDPAGVGVLEACKEKDIAYVGSILDQYDLAPEVVATSGMSDLSQSMVVLAKLVKDDKVEVKSYEMGVKEGVIHLAPFKGKWENEISQEIKDRLDELTKEISEDKIKVG